MSRTSNWRPKITWRLLYWSRNELAVARDLLPQCGTVPDFAPFYAVRSKAFEPVSRDQALTTSGTPPNSTRRNGGSASS